MMLIINLPVKTSQSAVDGPLVGVVAWDIKTEVVKKRERDRDRERMDENCTHKSIPPERKTSEQLYVCD